MGGNYFIYLRILGTVEINYLLFQFNVKRVNVLIILVLFVITLTVKKINFQFEVNFLYVETFVRRIYSLMLQIIRKVVKYCALYKRKRRKK